MLRSLIRWIRNDLVCPVCGSQTTRRTIDGQRVCSCGHWVRSSELVAVATDETRARFLQP